MRRFPRVYGVTRGIFAARYNCNVPAATAQEWNRIPRSLLTTLAVLLSTSVAVGVVDNIPNRTIVPKANCSADNSPRDMPMTKERLILELKEKLNICRRKLRNEGTKSQELPFLYIKSNDNGTHEIILNGKLSLRYSNSVALITQWTKLLNRNNADGILIQSADNNQIKFISKSNPSMYISFRDDAVSITKESYSLQDIDDIVAGYESFFGNNFSDASDGLVNASPNSTQTNIDTMTGDAVKQLESMGVDVYSGVSLPDARLDWDSLAGYEEVKAEVMSTIVNALQHPELYDNIAKQTREKYESNRPTAVLFDGSPGTGKTLTARILASQCNRPLIVLKLESFVSKWYGESEKKLAQILSLSNKIPGGSIIFIDEIDSVVTTRDQGNMHEVTRRILATLLTHMEGFNGKHNTKDQSLLICATNRKQDLDSALLSRFGAIIYYPLPSYSSRVAILRRYAKQLPMSDIEKLASMSNGLSCRDIKETCEQTERVFVGSFIKRGMETTGLPTYDDYVPNLANKKTVPSNYNA